MKISSPKPTIAYFVALALAGSLTACAAKQAQGPVASNTVRNGDKAVELRSTWEGQATSFTQRGKDQYKVGYYVKDGKVLAENSLLADKTAELTKLDLDVDANGLGFSAVIAHGKGTDLQLTGSIQSTDEGNGEGVSDFSGLGAMVIASDYAKVTMTDMDIQTKGFARAAFIVDNHANMVVKNSKVTTMGANPLTETYEGYVNSANVTKMVSPPWVLGIQGGVRASNSLGDRPVLSVIDSSVTAGGWAILSTDGCTAPQMNVVDSLMEILPQSKGGMTSGPFAYNANYGTGYGTYAIGNAKQNFYGATIKGTTYATIFTGGEATFASSNGDLQLKDGDGNVFTSVKGKGQPTVIDSVFGFMSHGDATLQVIDGTQVNTQSATFLYKAGAVEVTFDNAKLNSANGVIVQMIDNDDRIVGGNVNAFNTEFNEKAGWPSENGQITSKMPAAPAQEGPSGPGGDMPQDGMSGGPGGPGGDMPQGGMSGGPGGDMGEAANVVGPDGLPIAGASSRARKANGVTVTLLNGAYNGSLYNGTGYYGQSAVPMTVTIGKGAELKGAVSLTETRHINEAGKQNQHFTINEYYYLGHVENRPYRNGDSKVSVALKDGGKWEVSGESLLDSLTLAGGEISGANGKTVAMTVNGKPTAIKPGSYEGKIVISLQ